MSSHSEEECLRTMEPLCLGKKRVRLHYKAIVRLHTRAKPAEVKESSGGRDR